MGPSVDYRLRRVSEAHSVLAHFRHTIEDSQESPGLSDRRQRHLLTTYLGTPVAGAFRTGGWYTPLMVVTRKGMIAGYTTEEFAVPFP